MTFYAGTILVAHGYPILLDVRHRKALIVGGGRVAARKASGLLEAGASDVTVVAPQFVAMFPSTVIKLKQAYDEKLLDGVMIVFAATNRSEVNDRIVHDAKARGILVSRADVDDESPGDFVTPAKYQDQSVLVTVSAASAALAASIRDALRRRWDPRWTKMATAMQTLRPWVREHPNLSAEQRATIFRLLAQDEAMDILEAQDVNGLREWIVARHPELKPPG